MTANKKHMVAIIVTDWLQFLSLNQHTFFTHYFYQM